MFLRGFSSFSNSTKTQEQIETLEKKNKSSQENVSSLTESNNQLTMKNKVLEEENAKLSLKLQELEQNNILLNEKKQKMKKARHYVREKLTNLNTHMTDMALLYTNLRENFQKSKKAQKGLEEEKIQLRKILCFEKIKIVFLRKQNRKLRRRIEADEEWRKKQRIDSSKEYLQFQETRIPQDQLKNYYDCRIQVDSFFQLLWRGSWPIHIENWQKYQAEKSKKYVRVAIIGNKNVGKSWIASNLLEREIPQGNHITTNGVSILFPRETSKIPWSVLKTPGTNTAVKIEALKEEMEKYFKERNLSEEDILRMLYGDHILIETLLQEFIVNHSHILFIVVRKLKRDDQKLINRIKSLQGKRIIIIHNLLETKELVDVQHIIDEDIRKTFNAVEKNFSKISFIEQNADASNGKIQIEHVVLAHETSVAGELYNQTTLDYLKQAITSEPFSQEFDLVKNFYEHLNNHISYFFAHNQKKNHLQLETGQGGVPTCLKLSNPEKYELKLSSVDELGQIQTYGRDTIDIPYTIKTLEEQSQRYLQIEFEVVGLCDQKRISFHIHPKPNNHVMIEIRGRCENNTIRSVDPTQVMKDTRRFGDFLIKTDWLDLDGFIINRGETPKFYCDPSGLKILRWKLYENSGDSLE